MARVLFLTHLLPYPLVSGAKTRAYYVLRYLAANHQVTLLTFVRSDDHKEHIEHLESFLDEVHTVPIPRSWARNVRAVFFSLITGGPALIARTQVSIMRAMVEKLLSENHFDIVHADQIPMAQYGLQGKRFQARCLLDQHNATFQIIQRMAQNTRSPFMRLPLRREARAFARYEVTVCHQFDHVTFVTEDDLQALLTQMPDRPLEQRRTTVIPICVDTEAIKPVQLLSDPLRITHIGTMYWPPNVEGILWFLSEVWPTIHEQVPGAILTLIGKNPPDSLLALNDRPDVEVLGFVQNLDPYLKETAAFFVPLHAAGGMRVKIVDAWCWGVPIVSTTIGAEGIRIQDGDNILIADSPDEFSQAILRLLQQSDLREQMHVNGRQWVEDHYNWRRVYSAWDGIYSRLTAT